MLRQTKKERTKLPNSERLLVYYYYIERALFFLAYIVLDLIRFMQYMRYLAGAGKKREINI